jgi:hypothetical protein
LDEGAVEFNERRDGLGLPFEHRATTNRCDTKVFDRRRSGACCGEGWGGETGGVAVGVEEANSVGEEGCGTGAEVGGERFSGLRWAGMNGDTLEGSAGGGWFGFAAEFGGEDGGEFEAVGGFV